MRQLAQNVKPDLCSECSMFDDKRINLGVPRPSDIMVIGGTPTDQDISNGPFQARIGAMAKSMLRKALTKVMKDGKPKGTPIGPLPTVDYAYATQCRPKDYETKVTSENIEHCSRLLRERIARVDPKIILVLGKAALKGIGINSTVGSLRGNFTSTTVNGKQYRVLVTFHPVEVTKSPGLVRVYELDMWKVATTVIKGLSLPEMDLRTPRDYDGIMRELNTMERAINDHWEKFGLALAVSLDTETQGLTPERKDMEIIAVSLSHEDNLGLAFPWVHKDAFMPDTEFYPIKWRLEQILHESNDKIRIIEHNRKFDYKWTNLHEGLKLRAPDWDTMMMEHTIDEDKSGQYGLKDLTADYFPGWGKYETELKGQLDAVKRSREEAYKELEKAARAKAADHMLEWWLAKTDEERQAFFSEMLSRKLTSLKFSEVVTEKRRKLKGQMVITKKWLTLCQRFLKSLPGDVRPSLEIVLPDKTEYTKVTFEDIDIDVMLRYAAIDAVVTRKLVKEQLVHISRDKKQIQDVERRTRAKIPTKEILWPVKTIDIPLNTLLAEMEFHGVRVDRDLIRRYMGILDERIGWAAKEMVDIVGYEFNPNASKDVGKILFKDMNLPVQATSEKTGEPSVAADVIKDLSDQFPDNEFLDVLLAHRKMSKVKSTYLGNWLDRSAYDGKLHASFNQTGTATHRLSVTNPALQTVPFSLKLFLPEHLKGDDSVMTEMNLKSVFIPRPGYVIHDLDIANAEVRVLTGYADDPDLTRAFNEGLDLHCLTGSGISDFTYEDLLAHKDDKTTEQYMVRQISKKVTT